MFVAFATLEHQGEMFQEMRKHERKEVAELLAMRALQEIALQNKWQDYAMINVNSEEC
jgi:hypothetical protein